jgi:hypothetical protein
MKNYLNFFIAISHTLLLQTNEGKFMLNIFSFFKKLGVYLLIFLVSLFLLLSIILYFSNVGDNLDYVTDILDSKDCVRYIDNNDYDYDYSYSFINNTINIISPKLNVYIPSYLSSNNIINDNYIINNSISSRDGDITRDIIELNYKHEISKLHTQKFIDTLVNINEFLLENSNLIEKCENLISS